MNEYESMNGNASNHDIQDGRDVNTASDHENKYEQDSPSDGQRYMNPDGSHGFIYNPDESAREASGRGYRGAFIVAVSVLAAVLVISGCMFGAWMAARTFYLEMKNNAPSNSDGSAPDIETSGGLIFSDDTVEEGRENSALNPSVPSGIGSNEGNADKTDRETAPAIDSIIKLPPERKDEDGDGKADVEYDENGQVLTSAGKTNLTVATVVNRVAASVVEITTETVVQSGALGQYVTGGAGSGVIISAEGYVVTNNHVIEDANSITVRLNDGTEFPAILVGTDVQTDIAVLRIDPGSYPLTVAILGSSFDLVVGEDILAIGNPLGSLGGTVTEGMVSATARRITVSGNKMTLLQISAPINPGNSGGGLFNLAGELVGVVNAKMSSEEIEGLGFAVPVDTAYEIILELIHNGYVRGRPALDFAVVDVTNYQTAMYYFNSTGTGVYVYDRDHATVAYGDRIISADGEEIESVAELNAIIQQKSVGDTLELMVVRKRQMITLSVTITEYIPETLQAQNAS